MANIDYADKKLDAHLFICTNKKDGKECCANKDAGALRDALKTISKEKKEWMGRVRINNSGCLGHCENGIAAVLYPEGKWFTNLTKDDVKILESAVDAALD